MRRRKPRNNTADSGEQGAGSSKSDRRAKIDEDVNQIRSHIIGRDRKVDQRLTAADIRAELARDGKDVSLRHVRLAFDTLAAEGILKVIPQLGTVVRMPDFAEIGAVMEARAALESYVAFKLSQMDDVEARLSKVEKHNDELKKLAYADPTPATRERFHELDSKFHEELFRQADRAQIIDFLKLARRRLAIALTKNFDSNARRREVVAEHEGILAAIRYGLLQKPHEAPEPSEKKRERKVEIELAFFKHLMNSAHRSMGVAGVQDQEFTVPFKKGRAE